MDNPCQITHAIALTISDFIENFHTYRTYWENWVAFVLALSLKWFRSYGHLKFARNFDFWRLCQQLAWNISSPMTLREVIEHPFHSYWADQQLSFYLQFISEVNKKVYLFLNFDRFKLIWCTNKIFSFLNFELVYESTFNSSNNFGEILRRAGVTNI